jgi:phosphate transport system substrate-binding protein
VNFSSKRLFAAVIVASLALAACGDDDESDSTTADAPGATDALDEPAATDAPDEPAATDAPDEPAATDAPAEGTEPPATGDVELAAGEVFVSGSSTVEPISIRVGELASELSGGELKVTVEGPGTGDGFAKFCAGETDISDASRPINEEETQTCADAGIEYVELEVAIDGLTVATNPANADIECLDVPALYALIGPEAEGFANWSDANDLAAEVGSTSAPFPEVPLVVYGPGEESGTYDSFVEFAIADLAEERGADEATRADYTSSANDNLIVQGIESAETSLGWVGYAYFVAEQERMKSIAVDAGDGCVAPTEETISDGSYPFSRSLYIYVNTAKAAENPAVASFVDLYLSADGLAKVGEAGYVDLPADRIQASVDAWAAM